MSQSLLLYDASRSDHVRRATMNFRLKGIVFSVLFLSGSVFCLLAFLGYIPMNPGAEFVQPFMVVGSLFLLLVSSLSMRFLLLGGKYTKVYEDGIAMPWVRVKDLVEGRKQRFVPFSDIEAVYPNTQPNLNYVTVFGSRIGRLAIEKIAIDVDEFMEAVGERAEVRTETSMLVK